MSEYRDSYGPEARLRKSEQLYEHVAELLHPLIHPGESTREQRWIEFNTNPHFQRACASVVHFILSEKPDAEEHLRQAIEIDMLVKGTNKFLSQ